jgi:hypothetical protein
MQANIHLWSLLAKYFLDRKTFQTNVLEDIKTQISCSKTFFFRKSCRLLDNVKKYCRAGQATWQYGACALHAGYIKLQHPLGICNTYCFPLQQRLHESAMYVARTLPVFLNVVAQGLEGLMLYCHNNCGYLFCGSPLFGYELQCYFKAKYVLILISSLMKFQAAFYVLVTII